MSEEKSVCCCCTRTGTEYYKINGFDYCPRCFAEIERYFVIQEAPLEKWAEPRWFRMNEAYSGPCSEVLEYGHYIIEDKGRRADPTFSYRIKGKGHEFRFSMKSIPEDRREGLAQIIRRQLYQAYEQGQKTQREELRWHLDGIIESLGLGLVVPKLGEG